MNRIIMLALPFAAIAAGGAAGQTCRNPCRTQVGATAFGTWTRAGSPYCVSQDVTVGGLTIDPGVEVWIDAGATIIVATSLTVRGEPGDPVLFTERCPGQGWGGILFSSSSSASVIRHAIIERAHDSGVRIVDSSPTFVGCLIRDNRAPGAGGGVLASVGNGNLVLESCEIIDNVAAGGGGGLAVTMGAGFSLHLDRCTVARNACNPGDGITGHHWGGGLHLIGDGVIDNSALVDNLAFSRAYGCSIQVGQGGGIFANGGSLRIDNSILAGNLARGSGAGSGCYLGGHGRGGGLAFVANGRSLVMDNTIVCGNRVEATYGTLIESGSGVYLADGVSGTITNCTFTRNKNHALEIDGTNATATLLNSIVYFNNSLGTNPPTYGPQFAGATAPTATFCDVQNGFVGNGNIAADPFFLRPDCGISGPVVHPVSPCVDAGDPSGPGDAAFPPSRGSARNDMGAHGGAKAARFAAPCLQVAGAQPYGVTRGAGNTLRLDWLTSSGLSGFVRARNALAGVPGLLLIGIGPHEQQFENLTLLVSPSGLAFLPIAFDPSGQSLVPFALHHSVLLGIAVHVQALAFPTSGANASNGLALTFY